jgi:hypothetical protein
VGMKQRRIARRRKQNFNSIVDNASVFVLFRKLRLKRKLLGIALAGDEISIDRKSKSARDANLQEDTTNKNTLSRISPHFYDDYIRRTIDIMKMCSIFTWK